MGNKFWENNYYLEQPLKFRFKFKKLDRVVRGLAEVLKIFFIRNGLMNLVPNERIFERTFALTELPKKENLKILDLGCGDSIFPLELASLGYEVWGADPKEYHFKDRIKFVKGDFIKEKDKFPKNYFDVVTCVSAIEHFGMEVALGEKISKFEQNRKDIESIAICFDLLKKGGILILTTPYGEVRKLEKHERVYDNEGISELTKGFKLQKKRIVPARNRIIRDDVLHSSIFMGIFVKP